MKLTAWISLALALSVLAGQAATAERSDIKELEREYRADGVVTRAERRELDQRLDQASEEILLQKHDAQQR